MPFPSRPSILDIARAAGVSPVHVSSVVTGQQHQGAPVSPEVATRVRVAMASLGYGDREDTASEPGHIRNVMMLVRQLDNAASRMQIEQLQLGLAGHDLHLSVREGEGVEPIVVAAHMLKDGAIHGLIVETDDETAELLERMAAAPYPLVAIGPKNHAPSHDVITADDGNAIREAVLALIDRQLERYILISPRDDSNRDHGTTVARDQLRALGVDPGHITTLYSDHDAVDAFNATLPILQSTPPPVGVVAGSDSGAIGVLWACIRAGLRVPEDVAILGYGNSHQGEITTPAISTIGGDRDRFRQAADLIAERIEQPSLAGRHIVEPWSFMPRQTT